MACIQSNVEDLSHWDLSQGQTFGERVVLFLPVVKVSSPWCTLRCPLAIAHVSIVYSGSDP